MNFADATPTKMVAVVRLGIVLAVPVVLAMAAVGKLLDWRAFEHSIQSFRLMPPWVAQLGPLVPAVELLPVLLLGYGFARAANVLSFVILVLFSLLLTVHLAFAAEPECSCLGIWAEYLRFEQSTTDGLLRNAALLATAALGAIVSRQAFSAEQQRRNHRRWEHRRLCRRGFTLVEVLVTIVIITTVLALAVGLLAKMRSQSRSLASMSNLRSHAQILTMYTDDARGVFPYFTKTGMFSQVLEGGGVTTPPISYFDAHRTWHVALADDYYSGNARSRQFFSPRYRENSAYWPIYTSYHYPCTFIADPAYFDERTRTGPAQYRPVNMAQVQFPSAKTVLVETWHPPTAQDGRQVQQQGYASAFVDGSVHDVSWRERRSGYQKGDGWLFLPFGAVHFTDSPPMLHTIGGASGRDIE